MLIFLILFYNTHFIIILLINYNFILIYFWFYVYFLNVDNNFGIFGTDNESENISSISNYMKTFDSYDVGM